MKYKLSMLSDEMFLDSILTKHAGLTRSIFNNTTHYDQRKPKARHLIKEYGLANELVLGRTVEHYFKRAYGEEL